MALQKGLLLACLVAMGVTSVVVAQPPEGRRRGGGFGREMSGMFLLGQKSVQDELKLSEQQVSDATKAIEDQRGSFQGIFSAPENEREEMMKKARASADEAMGKILTADQAKRLAQIRLQVGGVNAFSSEETAKALSLTDDQKQQIAKIDEELSSERRKLFENRDGNRDENRKKMTELSNSAKEKAAAVLTAEQKTKWAEMVGAPFTGEITFGRGGRGGPGGRGDRPRGDRPERPAAE